MGLLGQFFGEAFGVLYGNRVRSLLTILGLIIGVAAVIAIQILGHGMSGAVSGVLGSLNDRSFLMFPNARQADITKAAFRIADINRAAQLVPNITVAMPAGGLRRIVSVGHRHTRLSISADSDVPFVNAPTRYGRNLIADDVNFSAHVAVLADSGYQRLFPTGGSPIGQSIRVGERRFAIVGVREKPLQGIIPISIGGDVFVPYTTYERDYVRSAPIFFARFIVADTSKLGETEVAVIKYFKTLKSSRSDYGTFDRKSFSTSIDGIFGVLTMVVAMIGAVSLVVAGIGIMNIMLVSVTERTREIGVRKAIGATSFQVLAQFFIEALLLSAIGCGIGLVIGLTIGGLVNRFLLIALSGVVAPIPWLQSVGIAVGFATIVTLVFGTYPAYRAARLDPIEALRYE
ncbi:MAG: ABC transporter permease [Candidatus Eremiobacteraeota bacterium]|nr:ABC transporter permease [Candidatus Eremiobacteraeota bacterium]